MSMILLLAAQAMGPEITTFHPLPSKEEQERELRQAQGLPPLPEVAPDAPRAAPQADSPKPPPEPKQQSDIKVMKVRTVAPDANVIFVPEGEEPPH